MSEQENPKVFRMFKSTANDVMLVIHPFSNMQLSKTISLTKRNPFAMLPADWAIGIFMDKDNYGLYKKGIISFDNNEALVKAAYEAGAYFSAELEFTPAKKDNTEIILTILKSGNHKNIESAVEKYGRDEIINCASANAGILPSGVVKMLESMLKIQLIVDGVEDTEM